MAMGKKRLMLLGGLWYLLPVIEAAHRQGYHVITADYLPDNIAHKYSDEYVNVSVVDKEAVLEAAIHLKIDGIMSFAVDPGVVAAAYVQQQMGLPSFGPYKSVRILQNKGLFRAFLREHGFNVPDAHTYGNIGDAMTAIDSVSWPVIVKPVDSAGSKGVTKVQNPDRYETALEHAFANSIGGEVIVEQFIEQSGCASDSDAMSVDGELRFVTFSAQRFDANAENPYAPSAFSWPSTFSTEQEKYLRNELQRLLTLLGMQTSIYNIETRIGKDGKPYIMEVSPRGGGNRLAEMVRLSCGVDLITACVRGAVGDEVELKACEPAYSGHWAEIVLHSPADGVFDDVEVREDMLPYLVEKEIRVARGETIRAFRGANDAIGTLLMRFDDSDQLEQALATQDEWIKIKVNNMSVNNSSVKTEGMQH